MATISLNHAVLYISHIFLANCRLFQSSIYDGIRNAELLTTEEAEPTEYVTPILELVLPLENSDELWLELLAELIRYIVS